VRAVAQAQPARRRRRRAPVPGARRQRHATHPVSGQRRPQRRRCGARKAGSATLPAYAR
jgi:hypothetical protein